MMALKFKDRILYNQDMIKPSWAFITSHPVHFLAFGFGTGLSPKAPGTVGTLIGLLLYGLLIHLELSATVILILLVLLFIVGIYICDFCGKALGVSDHSGIVWDEIVAVALVLLFVPFTVVGFFTAFALFRLFDIWKPFPIRYFDQHLHNGFGVMFDDLLAALYAIACILLIDNLIA